MDRIKVFLKDRKIRLAGLGTLGLLLLVLVAKNFGTDSIVLRTEDETQEEKILDQVDKIDNLEANQFGIYKDYLYKWSGGKLFLRSLSQPGESYNLALNIASPLIEVGNKYIFVSNPQEGIIYYVDSKAEMIERIPLNQGIFSFRAKNDNIIYHTKEGGQENLGLIDNQLNHLMKYDYKGESLLAYDYYPSKQRVAAAVLNVDEKSIGSRLDMYEDLSQKETIYFDKEIVIGLDYINLGNLLVLTDNNLYYVSENEIVWQKDVPLAKSLLIDGNRVYVLYGNHLMELDAGGEEKKKLTLSNQYNKMALSKGKLFGQDLVVYNDRELAIIRKDQEDLIHSQEILQLDTWKDTIFILDGDKYGFYKESIREDKKK